VRSVADAAAFLLELCALAAVAYRGYELAGVWLAVLLPVGFAATWGIFCAPRRRVDLGRRTTFALRVLLLLAAAVALGGRLGVAFAVAVLIDNAALLALR